MDPAWLEAASGGSWTRSLWLEVTGDGGRRHTFLPWLEATGGDGHSGSGLGGGGGHTVSVGEVVMTGRQEAATWPRPGMSGMRLCHVVRSGRGTTV